MGTPRRMQISIILPAYDVRDYIGAAIGSVLAQSHAGWELVIIDDGSTDGTGALAATFTDPRIRLIRQDNAGVSAARNRGRDLAQGEALLFLDADDWLAPDALARLAATLADADAADVVAAAGTFRFVAEDGTPSGHAASRHPPHGDLAGRLVVQNLFANGGHLLIRRTAIERAGRFATGLRYGEDWEYWCRLALLGRFVGLADPPVLFVRQRPSGAYLRLANDPGSFTPCMDAIFTNPALVARFGAPAVAQLRRRADAENAWIIGRELIRHGQHRPGRHWLRRSLAGAAGAKRGLLFVLACLPGNGIGPFRRYPPDS